MYDPQQKTLLADKGEIRVGNRYQADITDLLKEGNFCNLFKLSRVHVECGHFSVWGLPRCGRWFPLPGHVYNDGWICWGCCPLKAISSHANFKWVFKWAFVQIIKVVEINWINGLSQSLHSFYYEISEFPWETQISVTSVKPFVFLIKPHFPIRASPKLLPIKCCLPSSICPLLPGAFSLEPSPHLSVGCQPRLLTCRTGRRKNLLARVCVETSACPHRVREQWDHEDTGLRTREK